MDRHLTIGQMSKLFKLNAQTLHYYDSIGLLVPQKRDAETGYRKYSFEQIYKLATIRYLSRVGYSLKKIESYMEYKDIEDTLQSLKERSLSLRKQWEDLINIDTAIQRKIKFIELNLKNIDINKITIREYPNRYCLPIGIEDRLYLSDSFYFYPTVAFYDKDSKHFGAYIFCENEDEEKEFINNFSDVLTIPAGKYLCGYHLGPYETVNQTEKKVRLFLNNLTLADNMINFNIIDQFVEIDRNKYITELQIPIK